MQGCAWPADRPARVSERDRQTRVLLRVIEVKVKGGGRPPDSRQAALGHVQTYLHHMSKSRKSTLTIIAWMNGELKKRRVHTERDRNKIMRASPLDIIASRIAPRVGRVSVIGRSGLQGPIRIKQAVYTPLLHRVGQYQ